jgi:hypothetical protein
MGRRARVDAEQYLPRRVVGDWLALLGQLDRAAARGPR